MSKKIGELYVELRPLIDGVVLDPNAIERVAKEVYDRRHTKPPLGVMPENLWKESRQFELVRAMIEYTDQNLPIRKEWIIEYLKLTKKVV